MDRSDIVIVGGGLAAASAADAYRKADGTGSVTIISREPARPVHRPPLSKEYLRGEETLDKVFVHPGEYYPEHGISLQLETGAEAIDLASKQVSLSTGENLAFEKLVLATGARPRRLNVPGRDLEGVHYLRSLGSSTRLQKAATGGENAVIVGAGFIGMEVAASLTQRGVACTVVEVAPRMWARIVPEIVSTFIQRYFEERGVRFLFGRGVKALAGTDRVEAVILEDGTRLPADLVVAGVGAELNTKLAEAAGLETDRGVVVDEYLRTSHPDVYAIGDIAAYPDAIAGRIHLEHWDNALAQGRVVGRTLAGRPEPYEHIAYFFSDMFDLSLHMVGYPEGWDDIIVRGDPASGAFTTIYVKDGVIRAALELNDSGRIGTWRRLIRARQPVAGVANRLADPEFDPKSLMLAVAG
jgi:3-phenylpropionate/trans-cinnamate dioxygenase ferredoxin reductase subunit